MAFEFRKLTRDDWDQVNELDLLAEHDADEPGWIDYWRDEMFEFDRSAAAFDGGQLVGQSMTYSLGMSVPGGAVLPCGGVSWVAVMPTHRRRGIMREMIRRQIDDIHERGEPLAALYASEAPIYGRFGFGVATFDEDWEIETRRSEFESSPEAKGTVRFVDFESAVELFKPVHERAMRQCPGVVARAGGWWLVRLRGRESPPDKQLKTFQVAYEGESGIEGFASYAMDDDWPDFLPNKTLDIREFVTVSNEGYAGLWRYLLDVDLVATVKVRRPANDALAWMLRDKRAMKRTTGDGMYLRLVDVPAALEARSYGAEDSIVIEVRDEFCPWNDGRYRLEAGDGSRCSVTTDTADVTLDVRDLASMYLGGIGAWELARSGRIDDHGGDGVARIDRLFRWDVQPWPHLFW